MRRVVLITGTRKGLGLSLVQHYLAAGWVVIGCSRSPSDFTAADYEHHCLDVADEGAVMGLMRRIQLQHGSLDAVINNAGTASMNHLLLTPMATLEAMLHTNVSGTFLVGREAAKLLRRRRVGRIVNLTTIAVPLRLAGEATYVAAKAAVEALTRSFARELAPFGITCNAVGPTPIATDLIRGVPPARIEELIQTQAIRRMGEFRDVANVIDFFLRPESDFVTGQIVYLGGVS